MPLESDAFVSEYGWSMRVPQGFEQRKSGGGHNSLVKFEPISFSSTADRSTMLTWMVSGDSTDEDTALQFLAVTSAPGPIPLLDALQACCRIFPPIGQIDEAVVVELPDGRRGLELLETFSQPGSSDVRRGYQLIVADIRGQLRTAHFERLCFYAPESAFDRLIDDVRDAARTFHRHQPERV